MEAKQDLLNKIRLKQLELNQVEDWEKRNKLLGDLAVLQAKLNLVKVKERSK